jgi:hypothetical protein
MGMIQNGQSNTRLSSNIKNHLKQATYKYNMSEHFDLQNDNFDKMADFFYTNGYVILHNALDSETV